MRLTVAGFHVVFWTAIDAKDWRAARGVIRIMREYFPAEAEALRLAVILEAAS
jgi:hypothetical protein